MRLVFDLDGVFRELNLYLKEKYSVPYPTDWFDKFKGRDIFEWARVDDYHILIEAPPTKYLDVVKRYIKEPEIWTCQPEDWKPYTNEWIDFHIGKCKVIYMTSEEKRERLDKENGCILVEDYPLFTNYDRIILIDRPYNRCVRFGVRRISTAQEFETLFLPYGRIK